jgi:hypothetical protein
MSLRAFIYSTLTLHDLPGQANQRVFPKRSMKSSVEEHPYIVYKLGNNTNMGLSEVSAINQQYFQVYVHDYTDTQTADYGLIDEVLEAIKALLVNASSATDGAITIQYLETSQDLNDETLGTLFRYLRFFAIVKEPDYVG